MNDLEQFIEENKWNIISFILFESMLVLCALGAAAFGAWGFFAVLITIMVIPILWTIVFLLFVIIVMISEKEVDKDSESV